MADVKVLRVNGREIGLTVGVEHAWLSVKSLLPDQHFLVEEVEFLGCARLNDERVLHRDGSRREQLDILMFGE